MTSTPSIAPHSTAATGQSGGATANPVRTWCIPGLKHATANYKNFCASIPTYDKSAEGLLALSVAAGFSADPLMRTEGYSAVNELRNIFASAEPTEEEWTQYYKTTYRLAGGRREFPEKYLMPKGPNDVDYWHRVLRDTDEARQFNDKFSEEISEINTILNKSYWACRKMHPKGMPMKAVRKTED